MPTKKSARNLNGYRVVYKPEHSRSMKTKNWNGYVYEHIVVAESSIGRSMTEEEVVHHLDGDRSNNRQENLLVLLRSQHAKLHIWLDKGAPMEKFIGKQGMNSGKSNAEPKKCVHCGTSLQNKAEKYCSIECSRFCQRRVERPSREQLSEEIKSSSILSLGKKYGVSDNAIRKWAKAYGLL